MGYRIPHMNKIMLAFCTLAIGAVVLFGLFLFWKGARNIQMAVASEKWPTAPGTVISVDTTRDATRETRKSPSIVTFNTRTVIQYAVNGREYTTDVLFFGQTLGSGDKSDAALQRLRYPVGQAVMVSYDPERPATAVMRPGLHAAAFWLPGAGLAFLLPAALCLFLGPSMLRNMTANDDALQKYVEQAMAQGQRGEIPMDRPFTPPRQGGDAVMMIAAAGFGLLLCGGGILALTSGLQRIWHGMASQSWPTVPGSVVFTNESGGLGNAEADADTSNVSSLARFVYQYEVAGTRHYNNVRQFSEVEGGREELQRIGERYKKGAKVKVSYFPTDPDVAVLEPGNTSAAMILPAIGAVLVLFSLVIFIWMVPALGK
jgi:hypothetical protein